MSPRCTSRLVLTLVVALVVLGATPAAFGQATSITSTGFRASEGGGGALSTEWTTGNLGNTWSEGEWVPYQLIISNVQTDYPDMVDFPDIVMEYDFTAQNDARFVDLVRSIQVGTTQLTDDKGWPADGGGAFPMTTRQEIEEAQNDIGNAVPLENTWAGFTLLNLPNSQVNRSSPPGFDVGTPTDQFRYFYITRQDLVDAGLDTTTNTIIIYYQLHESRSFIWANSLQEGYDASPTDDWGGYLYSDPAFAADSRNGSGYVPGSSGQLRVSFASGDKTVPIPIPERLPGAVSGLKWHDIDGDGLIDGGEPMLSGWRIYVSGTLEGIFFSQSVLTDGSGIYSFPNLTSNVDWSIFEAAQQEVPATTGWSQTYPSPGDVVGVGTGTDFGFDSDTANVGWLVALDEVDFSQPDMNFGNRLCEVVITCPPDVELECDAPTTPDATGYPVVVTGNCGPLDTSYTDNVLQGVCGVDGYVAQIERTWVVTDDFDNADTCVQYITQIDTTPPILPTAPPDETRACDADLTPPNLNPPTDNCDPDPVVSMRQDIIPGDCPQEYTIINWWIAVDDCGNADSVSQTIEVVDTEAPVITCPADATFECDEDIVFGQATAVDNCDEDPEITFVDAQVPGACAQEYTLERTWTATDACGNSSSCVQTISVVDTTPPVITCPADATFECDATIDFGQATATDNCDEDPAITYSDETIPGQCPQEYTIERTWTATDDCGNAASCVQTVTVVDTTPPVVVCPPDISADCDDVPDFGTASATDNCDPDPSVRHEDDTLTTTCPLEIARSWIAEDACGNADTCIQVIVVDDTTPPVITCPSDATFECDEDVVFGQATAVDNCDQSVDITWNDVQAPGSCPQEYTITRTWTATDDCGNSSSCVQIISVVDTTPPVISCPSDRRFECDAVGDFGTATATDNCDPDPQVSLTGRDSVSSCPQSYVLTLTYQATDACGNSSTCQQVVTVEDTTPPVLTCAPDDSVDCGDEVIFTPPSVSDNCDPAPAVSIFSTDTIPGPTIGEFTHTRTWVAVDACGNESFPCSQSIIVLACPDSGCTFTMGGWGSKCPPGQQGDPLSTQPGCIRDNYFAQVFPNGVTIGDASGYTATWTSAAAVRDYLPAGGTPRSLTMSYTDPTSTSAGVLGGQILALTLNVEYSCAGVWDVLGIGEPGFCYAPYVIPEYCGKFAGITVDSFLTLANLVLSGDPGAVDGYDATWSDINYTATCLNELFNDCDPSAPDVSLTDLGRAGLTLGDVNYDGQVITSDIIYLANYILRAGAPPVPFEVLGDVDWNREVSISDVIFLADWLLKQPVLTRGLQLNTPDAR